MINSSLQNITLSASPSKLPAGSSVSQSGMALPEETEAGLSKIAVSVNHVKDSMTQNTDDSAREPENLTVEVAEEMAGKMNDMIKSMQRDLEFAVDQESGRTVFKVIHTSSGDVIRQVPSEEALELAEALADGRAALITEQA